MKWISWRISCGSGFVKFYGQIEKDDLNKIGNGNVKVYNPMVSKSMIKPSEIEGGCPSIMVSTTSVLDFEDYDCNYQIINTSHFISWQVVNNVKCIASLDGVVEEIKQRKKESEEENIQVEK